MKSEMIFFLSFRSLKRRTTVRKDFESRSFDSRSQRTMVLIKDDGKLLNVAIQLSTFTVYRKENRTSKEISRFALFSCLEYRRENVQIDWAFISDDRIPHRDIDNKKFNISDLISQVKARRST